MMAPGPNADAQQWRRLVSVLLDGLRAPAT
jgi:hypothetical protein